MSRAAKLHHESDREREGNKGKLLFWTQVGGIGMMERLPTAGIHIKPPASVSQRSEHQQQQQQRFG